MSLPDKVKHAKIPSNISARRTSPLWQGPEKDGITFSLLSRFLCCRERFRLLVVEGIRPRDTFNHRIEYGNMWHTCEEALAGATGKSAALAWMNPLQEYATRLAKKYPAEVEQVDHWYRVCKVQFPLYVKFWRNHQDVMNRTPLLQEQVFDVLYSLPSRRLVRLRGKWDSVDLIGTGKTAGIYLQENKTKGDIREEQLKRQLTFDLQTMMYLAALEVAQVSNSDFWRENPHIPEEFSTRTLRGVRYNVIRRPLSGGKGTIVRHKARGSTPAETKDHFYDRVNAIIEECPQDYFMRWKVEVHPHDIDKFCLQCLDPILEQLCDWWEWISSPIGKDDLFHVKKENESLSGRGVHWRHPFGVYNVMDEGGVSDLDEYLATGSEVGLTRVENLFPEL